MTTTTPTTLPTLTKRIEALSRVYDTEIAARGVAAGWGIRYDNWGMDFDSILLMDAGIALGLQLALELLTPAAAGTEFTYRITEAKGRCDEALAEAGDHPDSDWLAEDMLRYSTEALALAWTERGLDPEAAAAAAALENL
jgi:hypothetical protein